MSRVALCLALMLLPGAVRARDRQDSPAARAFAEGTELYQQTHYRRAIAAFAESFKLHPHFLTLCNIARCHERLSDMVQAATYYQRCLAQGGETSPKAKQMRKAHETVLRLVARITVASPGSTPAEAFVDGVPVGRTPHEVLLNPGPHQIEVRRPGARPRQTLIEAHTGEVRVVTLHTAQAGGGTPQPAPGPRPTKPTRRTLSPVWFWAASGLTIALAIAGTALGIKTLQANGDYESTPTEDGYDKVLDLRLATNICWGLTAAAAATSTTLFFFTDFGRRTEQASAGSAGGATARIVVLGLQGRF